LANSPAPFLAHVPPLRVDKTWRLRNSADSTVPPAQHAIVSVLLHGLCLAGLMAIPLDQPQAEPVSSPAEFTVELAVAPEPKIEIASAQPPAIPHAEPAAAENFPIRPTKRRPLKPATPATEPEVVATAIEAVPKAPETTSSIPGRQTTPILSEPSAATGLAAAPAPAAGGVTATHTLTANKPAAIAIDVPVIQHPRFRRQPRPPQYPARAKALDQQGTCIVRALIDQSGSSKEILLWRSSGYELLDQAALAAVRGWSFDAARQNDEPILAWVEIPVRFEIR